jgi:hypothetical protein
MKSPRPKGNCVLGIVGVLLLSACTEGERGPMTMVEVPAPVASVAEVGRFGSLDLVGQELAQALAAGLADPGVRVSLRNAMRFSPYNEHKLVLQEFVETGPGRLFLRSASRESGVPEARLRELIGALPALDFYAPVPEHRLAWRATSDVLLGLNLDTKDPTLNAYGAGGEQVFLHSGDGVPQHAVLILHPAEPKGLRPGADSTRPGETISDSETEGVLLSLDGDDCGGGGDEMIAPITCDTQPIGGGISPHALLRFMIHQGDGWGGSEVKFRIIKKELSGSETILHVKQFNGIKPGQWYEVDWRFNGMGSYAHAEEQDSWLTFGNDDWGYSYPNWQAFPGSRGYAPSGHHTVFINHCGTVFRDGAWEAYCTNWYDPHKTVTAVFEY